MLPRALKARAPVAAALVLSIVLGACSRREREGERAPPASAVPEASADAHREVHLRPSRVPLATRLVEEAREARRLGLRPFVELGASWCKPCRDLDASLSDPRVKAALRGVYLVRIDFDEWAGRLGSAGLGAQAIPVFFELSADGTVTGRKLDGGAWGADVPENIAPKLDAFFHGT